MNDTKLQDSASSSESPKTTAPEPHAAPPTPAQTSPAAELAQPPAPSPASRYNPVVVNPPASQLADFAAFLKRTWRIWTLAIGAFVGLVLLVVLLQRLTEMAKAAEQKRYEKAIASLVPERLIARCGAPAEDATKEVFPVVMRTIRYERHSEKLVFTFSRTAEQQSDWVFLTMQDQNGTRNLDAPESKILAFPCLDSTK